MSEGAGEGKSVLEPVLHCRQGHTRWSQLHGSSHALALAMLAAGGQAPGPLLILTAGSHQADTLLDELRFYLPDTGLSAQLFPDWETLPYDALSPHQDIISQRLQTLRALPDLTRGVVVAPIAAALARLLPRRHLAAHTLRIETGQTLDMQALRRRMTENGYHTAPQVLEHGDMAVRGALIDLFPMGAERPLRIEWEDDSIVGIRRFDPETQRTLEHCKAVDVLPACELDLSEAGRARFCRNWRRHLPDWPEDGPVYEAVSQGRSAAGGEYYLPLFYEHTSSLFDYLPDTGAVVWTQETRPALERFREQLATRHENGREERPLLAPDLLFLNETELHTRAASFHQLHIAGLGEGKGIRYASRLPAQLPVDVRAPEPLLPLQTFLAHCPARVLLVAASPGRQETLLELFAGRIAKPERIGGWLEFLHGNQTLAVCVGRVRRGLWLEEPGLVVIPESQLFGQPPAARRGAAHRRREAEAAIHNLAELSIGAPVVHLAHGIGRYAGLEQLGIDALETEFIVLEYAQGDRLYVPVTDLELIGRYTGADAEHAPLHRLGSGQWARSKQRAARRIHDVAAELLEIHARRAARPGYRFQLNEEAYRSFAQGFPFVETPDQHDAIARVLHDMQQPRPMDRLICGDAGFGKTEIALRAAFVAVDNLRQAAVLAPTTLLAQQHYENFRDRFANWPVRIDMLSRFRTPSEQKSVLQALREGKVDIIIGTHRLLQRDLRFARLGLLILDEEHRFGVRQKERFKTLRAEVDVLTLTATPIPRTLHLALSGIREFSLINTPPSHRLAVKTFVRQWDDALIREVMMRELGRGGQVFFLHNEVRDIERIAARLKALLPEARVRVAHGQMPERELESIMLDFHRYRFNVLVCTTIIESGLDIASANTIIINRAHRFGLAQLYQLRGRVGRSHHRAYAWLLVPQDGMTEDAKKRLQAIESLEQLGIGFTLATHDLEIRGAGELLGDEQSGHIQELGFGVYMELLENTVAALRAGEIPQLDRVLDHGMEINLGVPGLIPEDYLADPSLRLIMYKRIASARDRAQLQALREELIDRFGLLPAPAQALFQLAALKIDLQGLGVKRIDMDRNGGRILFTEQTRVVPEKVLQLLQEQPQDYRLDGAHKLRITRDCPDAESRFQALHTLLAAIT